MKPIRTVIVAAALLFACATPEAKTGAPSGQSPVGGACTKDSDCAAGMTCDKDDPGGQCEKKCTSIADCGANAVCNPEKECAPACKTSSDCRAGYACTGAAPDLYCDDAAEVKDKK